MSVSVHPKAGFRLADLRMTWRNGNLTSSQAATAVFLQYEASAGSSKATYEVVQQVVHSTEDPFSALVIASLPQRLRTPIFPTFE